MPRNTLHLSCPQCGSHNVEIRNSMPSGRQDTPGKVLDWLKAHGPSLGPVGMPPMGQKFIVCKDCGNTSSVMFN